MAVTTLSLYFVACVIGNFALLYYCHSMEHSAGPLGIASEQFIRSFMSRVPHEYLPTRAKMVFLGSRPDALITESYLRALMVMLKEFISPYSHLWQDGYETRMAEKECAEFLGVAGCRSVDTGSSALNAMLLAAGIGWGDEVVVPTHTWVATAGAVLAVHAVPVFADIDESTGMDPESLRRVITPRTKAVIAAHLYGIPCEIGPIAAVAKEKGIILLEDAAQAWGAHYHGQLAGTFGRFGMTSINPSKLFHTGGQGGLVWARDPQDAEVLQRQIQTSSQMVNGIRSPLPTPGLSDGSAEHWHSMPLEGQYLQAQSNWHAAFLRSQLRYIAAESEVRRSLMMVFRNRLKPEYRDRYWAKVSDPEGARGEQIVLLMGCKYMVDRFLSAQKDMGLVGFAGNHHWRKFYLPHIESMMKKVHFSKSSSAPYITEEQKAPLSPMLYNRSRHILERTLGIAVSYYSTAPILEYAADTMNHFFDYATSENICESAEAKQTDEKMMRDMEYDCYGCEGRERPVPKPKEDATVKEESPADGSAQGRDGDRGVDDTVAVPPAETATIAAREKQTAAGTSAAEEETLDLDVARVQEESLEAARLAAVVDSDSSSDRTSERAVGKAGMGGTTDQQFDSSVAALEAARKTAEEDKVDRSGA